MAVSGVLVCFLLTVCALHYAAAQPADSEGASFSVMPEYVQWVQQRCGDPASTKTAECLALKDKLCGKRDTSEVLCLPSSSSSPPVPEARFKSASRYTRVTYLRCSLLELKCSTDRETYSGPARSVDPKSLAAWVQYVSKCTAGGRASSNAPTLAAECAKLSGAHCSRSDVRCSKGAAEFLESNKKVVLRGDYQKGLAYLV